MFELHPLLEDRLLATVHMYQARGMEIKAFNRTAVWTVDGTMEAHLDLGSKPVNYYGASVLGWSALAPRPRENLG